MSIFQFNRPKKYRIATKVGLGKRYHCAMFYEFNINENGDLT